MPLALCCQHRQCVAAIRPLGTASWKCHYAVFFPAFQEQRGKKDTVRIGLCSQVGYLLDVLTLPLPLQEEHGINPLQGEMHWSCPLRIFTWPFCGATIVSEGTALNAGDQGYCLLKTDGQAGRSCALTLSVARIVHKCACFLTLQTQSRKCWGNSWYLNFLYLPILNSGSK